MRAAKASAFSSIDGSETSIMRPRHRFSRLDVIDSDRCERDVGAASRYRFCETYRSVVGRVDRQRLCCRWHSKPELLLLLSLCRLRRRGRKPRRCTNSRTRRWAGDQELPMPLTQPPVGLYGPPLDFKILRHLQKRTNRTNPVLSYGRSRQSRPSRLGPGRGRRFCRLCLGSRL